MNEKDLEDRGVLAPPELFSELILQWRNQYISTFLGNATNIFFLSEKYILLPCKPVASKTDYINFN